MQEARELANDPCTDYTAAPLEDDIFEWHCTLRGPAGTDFEGGLYHFRILLPAEYPFRPPSLMMLTPNGRFELNTKICISFTSYHEELWQPAWGVRTAILGLQGFFPLKGQAAVGVGSIENSPAERKRLAALSREWICPRCQQSNLGLLPDPMTERGTRTSADTQPSSMATEEPNLAEVSRRAVLLSESVPTISQPNVSSSAPSTAPSIQNVSAVTADGHAESLRTMATSSRMRTAGSAGSNQVSRQNTKVLDSVICVLLVIALGIACRRMI